MIILEAITESGHYGRTSLRCYISPKCVNDLVYDLRSPNKGILDMLVVMVHVLTLLAKFQNQCSRTVGPSGCQSLTCIASIDLIW